jgi:hypothetical protein
LIQRESFPPRAASITSPFSREKKKGVIRVVRIARRQLHRIIPRHVFARVFDDALAFPDRRDRVDAFAMHA